MMLDHLSPATIAARGTNKARRFLAERFGRRMIPIRSGVPIVSFSFDDAPKTAFEHGGAILREFGARATYYVSLGLLDTDTEVGPIASLDDLARACSEGSELGCHTFDHLDAWQVDRSTFMASVNRNRAALQQAIPDAAFPTFAYPKSGASLVVKAALGKTFMCCRGGGQSMNATNADLNLLKACFIDQRTGVGEVFIRELVARNAAQGGWLIFATHDVAADPSPYGCTPQFLEMTARQASRSGASLLPVGEACMMLLGSESPAGNAQTVQRAS